MPSLGFLNSLFLAGLAAAAIPILIHLFSRKRAKNLPFSTLMFLQEISRKKIRRLRLRQFILLALRVLIIAFFALAMGRPVVKGLGGVTERGSSTLAIVLDDSYSMGALLATEEEVPAFDHPRALTRFDLALQRVGEILDLLEKGDRAFLVFAASPIEVPYETPVQDFGLIQEILERTSVRMTRADLLGAIERSVALLADSKSLNKELFIVSDFQRQDAENLLQTLSGPGRMLTGPAGALRADAGDPEASGVGPEGEVDGLLPFPEEVRVYQIPVWGQRRDNVALRRADYQPDPVDPARGGQMSFQARNFSESPVDHVVARLLTAGAEPRLVGETAFSVEPQGVTRGRIALSALGDLTQVDGFVLETTPDALWSDNHHYVALGEDRTYRVLLVTGDSPSDPDIEDEYRFVRTALDPWGDTDQSMALPERVFSVEPLSANDLGLMGEIKADAVILLNVGRLPPQAVESLSAYRARGGGILIVAGDRVDPRYYNSVLLESLSELRLGSLYSSVGDEAEGDEAYFVMRPERTGHPVFAGFPIGPGENLTQTRFRKSLECHLGSTAQVLASFSNGLPALVDDRGLLLFTSSFDGEWSDFPTSGAFLPFLHKSLFFLIRREEGRGSGLRAGESFRWLTDPSRIGDTRVLCRGPEGLTIPVELRESGEGTTVVTDPLPLPGIYLLMKESGEILARAAVNLDTDESDLHAMTDSQSEVLFGDEVVRLEPARPIDRSLLEARFGKELWRPLLILVFLLLLVESLLARGRLAP